MKRPQYFAAKPIQDPDLVVENEILMWRSVLDQALQDISYVGIDNELKEYRIDAEEWLVSEVGEFNTVCDYSYLDNVKTRDEFYYIMRLTYARRRKTN